jgi:hypothetical protein
MVWLARAVFGAGAFPLGPADFSWTRPGALTGTETDFATALAPKWVAPGAAAAKATPGPSKIAMVIKMEERRMILGFPGSQNRKHSPPTLVRQGQKAYLA